MIMKVVMMRKTTKVFTIVIMIKMMVAVMRMVISM